MDEIQIGDFKVCILWSIGLKMASTKRDGEEQPLFPWAELPSEVQISVLGWLPLRPLFRSKLVCKLWNSTISSPSFTHFPSLLNRPCSSPWLIFSSLNSFDLLLAFDFDELSWFKLDVGFLSPFFNASYVKKNSGCVWCTRTASGLLLLHRGPYLHVCNPLTKSLFKLPPFKSIEVLVTQGFSTLNSKEVFTLAKTDACLSLHHESGCTAPVVSSTSSNRNAVQGLLRPMDVVNDVTEQHECASEVKGPVAITQGSSCRHVYTVVAIGKGRRQLEVEAYCPVKNSWEIVGSMPASFTMRLDRLIECDGLFYCLLLNPIEMLEIGKGVDGGDWKWRIQALPVGYWKVRHHLLACQSSIFLVCYDDLRNNGIVIWRYQADSNSWIKLQDMPDCISQDVMSISNPGIDCVGVGNFICFRVLGTLKVLTYNLCNNLWTWLPKPSEAYDTNLARGLQFEPRLDYTKFC